MYDQPYPHLSGSQELQEYQYFKPALQLPVSHSHIISSAHGVTHFCLGSAWILL